MYLVIYHGNHIELWLKLQGAVDWCCWKPEYQADVQQDVRESESKVVAIKDLPAEITQNFDFDRRKGDVKRIYKL